MFCPMVINAISTEIINFLGTVNEILPKILICPDDAYVIFNEIFLYQGRLMIDYLRCLFIHYNESASENFELKPLMSNSYSLLLSFACAVSTDQPSD